MFGRKKIYNCKKLIHVFKIAWVKESTLCVNSFLKNYFCKKVCSFCEKRTSKIWDVLFLLSYLPPLSDFVLFCLTPPSPPKIGHHLCTFPWGIYKYIYLCKGAFNNYVAKMRGGRGSKKCLFLSTLIV